MPALRIVRTQQTQKYHKGNGQFVIFIGHRIWDTQNSGTAPGTYEHRDDHR